MSDELPPAWRTHADRKGLGSYRRLGAAAGISHEAARRVVRGWNVRPQTVQSVADALGVDPEVIYELRSEAPPDTSRDWTPPESSSLLTHEEREALSRLVSLLTAGRAWEDEGHGRDAAATSRAGESPAPAPPELDLSDAADRIVNRFRVYAEQADEARRSRNAADAAAWLARLRSDFEAFVTAELAQVRPGRARNAG